MTPAISIICATLGFLFPLLAFWLDKTNRHLPDALQPFTEDLFYFQNSAGTICGSVLLGAIGWFLPLMQLPYTIFGGVGVFIFLRARYRFHLTAAFRLEQRFASAGQKLQFSPPLLLRVLFRVALILALTFAVVYWSKGWMRYFLGAFVEFLGVIWLVSQHRGLKRLCPNCNRSALRPEFRQAPLEHVHGNMYRRSRYGRVGNGVFQMWKDI